MRQGFARREESPLGPALLAVLVVLLFWLLLPADLRADEGSDYSNFYAPVARNVLAGHGLTLGGNLAIGYPPGYPLILAGVFGLAAALHLPDTVVYDGFTLLCMAGSAALVFLLARCFWSVRAAWGVAALWMTYPLFLWLTKQPSSEVPFVVLFYGALYVFLRALLRQNQRAWPYLGAGVLLGGAMLIRPIALGVPLLLALLLVWANRAARARRIVLAGMLLLGAILPVLPWEVTLYQNQGKFIPLSTAGAAALRDGLTFAVRLKGFRQGTLVPDDVRAAMADFDAHYSEMQDYGGVARQLQQEWQVRPVTVIKLFLLKAARSWYGTDSQRYEGPILLLQLVYLIPALVAGVFCWRRGGPARLLAGSVGLIVAYFWGMNILSTTLARYAVPLMGLIFLVWPALWVILRLAIRHLSVWRVPHEVTHRNPRTE